MHNADSMMNNNKVFRAEIHCCVGFNIFIHVILVVITAHKKFYIIFPKLVGHVDDGGGLDFYSPSAEQSLILCLHALNFIRILNTEALYVVKTVTHFFFYDVCVCGNLHNFIPFRKKILNNLRAKICLMKFVVVFLHIRR